MSVFFCLARLLASLLTFIRLVFFENWALPVLLDREHSCPMTVANLEDIVKRAELHCLEPIDRRPDIGAVVASFHLLK